MKKIQGACVEEMKKVAEKGHAGALRKDGVTAYIEHPRAVVQLLEAWGVTNEVSLAVAWGHDLLEEVVEEGREAMRAEIRAAGGEAVLAGIEQLTFLPSAEARKDKALKASEKAAYLEGIARNASQEVRIVKIADRLCNARDFLALGRSAKADEYLKLGAVLWERPLDSGLSEKVDAEIDSVEAAIRAALATCNDGHTEVVFVVDRSGSMSGLVDATISGFNEVLENQRNKEGVVKISTVLFDHEHEVIHSHEDISKVEPLTRKVYVPRGSTALVDAIGRAMAHMKKHQCAMAESSKRAAHVLFVIITDGFENASHEYSAEDVRKEIKKGREQESWEFIFLGANIDAVETATRYGMDADLAMDYVPDAKGTKHAFRAASHAMFYMRMAEPCMDATMILKENAKSIRKNIDEDFQKRSGKGRK